MPGAEPRDLPAGVRLRWWRVLPVRALIALVVTGGGLWLASLFPPRPERHWTVPGLGLEISTTPRGLFWFAVVVALAVAMPHASYRVRDVLLLLVPIYGIVVVVKVVTRVLYLPRRDWPPRPDEIPRAVRIPHGEGDYFLARDVAEAENHRARWTASRGVLGSPP